MKILIRRPVSVKASVSKEKKTEWESVVKTFKKKYPTAFKRLSE